MEQRLEIRPHHAPDSSWYRTTETGRAYIEQVERDGPGLPSTSRYVHDLLLVCTSAVGYTQLRQLMPLRPLEEALRQLLELGLVAPAEPPAVQRHNVAASANGRSAAAPAARLDGRR